MTLRPSNIHFLLVGLCLVLFTASATTDLALPGPEEEEAVHACLAIDLMHPPYPLGKYTLRIGNQPFPFGATLHTGALKAYMLWPLFAAFGPSVELMRLFTVFLGLLTLLFSYLFIRETFGRWEAFLGTLFLSLDTSFIFYSKLDCGPIVEQLLWMMVCLWSFFHWKKNSKWPYLFLGLFSAILGIYSHISFIWFSVAFVIALWLFEQEAFLRLFRRPAVFWVALSGICFLTLFFYWLIGERAWLFRKPPGPSGLFVMFERLSVWGGILPEVLLGKVFKGIPPSEITARPLSDMFLIFVLLFFIFRYPVQPKEARFLLVLSSIMSFEFLGTPGGFVIYPHRLMPVYLFLILLAGVAVVQSGQLLRRYRRESHVGRLASFAVLFLASLSLWGQVSLTQEAIQKIRRSGGKGSWSDAIYSFSEWVGDHNWDKVVCADWFIRRPLFLLTEGKIPIKDPFSVDRFGEVKRIPLNQLLRASSPSTLFLLCPKRKRPFGLEEKELKEVAQEVGLEAKLEQLFYDRERNPLYMAYTVRSKKQQ